MSKIAVDCDGVLADFGEAFNEEANRIWPGKVSPGYVNTHWDDLGGLTAGEQDTVWERIKATPNWWMGLRAYSNEVGMLESFLVRSRGQDVYIVTSRAPTVGMSIAYQTEQWLLACGVRMHTNYLGVIATAYPSEKARLYKAMGMDYSVDDKGETVEGCDKVSGHEAFLLDRPWNQGAKVKRRIKLLEEFFEAVK